MTVLGALIKRNCKLFFKDKGMFFTSLITPIILLVLYVTFLAKVFRDSFSSAIPEFFAVSDDLINATVGGQLVSSLLAVCCVTVAFCTNLLMVQDKISGARRDLTIAPVKGSVIALGYFVSSALSTLIICYTALVVCVGYLRVTGWFLTGADVARLFLDVFLLVLFGTSLSSLVNMPLSTNGQGSAVGTIVSAGYGFICGAYMPLSNFGEGLQKALSFLPGTYGTSLIRNHAMAGAYREMEKQGFPQEVIEGIRDAVDCNIYFFDNKVSVNNMYLIVAGATVLLILAYVLINALKKEKR